MTRLIKTLLVTGTVGLSMLAMSGGAARADVIPSLVAGSPSGSGPFTYTYDVTLTHDQRLVSGNFFTIYDFAGFTGTHSEQLNWTFSSSAIGVTPGSVIPKDGAGEPNLTWTYTGPNTGSGPMDLGLFTADSTRSQPTLGWFAGEGIKVDPGQTDDGTVLDNVGRVTVPSAVPEPGSLALLGLGIAPLFGGLRRRFRKS